MILQRDPLAASAVGIFHCLRRLAEEAATLNMPHTLFAIEQALAVVASETEDEPIPARRH
jgi:hypothetical protein